MRACVRVHVYVCIFLLSNRQHIAFKNPCPPPHTIYTVTFLLIVFACMHVWTPESTCTLVHVHQCVGQLTFLSVHSLISAWKLVWSHPLRLSARRRYCECLSGSRISTAPSFLLHTAFLSQTKQMPSQSSDLACYEKVALFFFLTQCDLFFGGRGETVILWLQEGESNISYSIERCAWKEYVLYCFMAFISFQTSTADTMRMCTLVQDSSFKSLFICMLQGHLI